MLSDKLVAEVRAVIQTQRLLLGRLDTSVSTLEYEQARQAGEIESLQNIMAEIERCAGFLTPDDLPDSDAATISAWDGERHGSVASELNRIGFVDWDSFVRKCQVFDLEAGLDPLEPYESLLTDADSQRLRGEAYGADFRWDKWDYIAVGVSGVLAALTDYLLVGIPKTTHIGQYAGQRGSPITEWLDRYNANSAKVGCRSGCRNFKNAARCPMTR